VLRARSLLEFEQDAVRQWLSEPECSLFFAQAPADQRHGYSAALTVVASGSIDMVTVRAALLHDVGKRHARLGVIGRVLASVLILLHLPLRGRLGVYRDHGEIAASELAAIGAEQLVVDFARHHHRSRPITIDVSTWDLLQKADQPPKTRARNGPGIS
jgi:putative nucleotidyltransferase with HDIG domain